MHQRITWDLRLLLKRIIVSGAWLQSHRAVD